MKIIKERIFKEKVTSTIGLFIIVASFVFLWFEKINAAECAELVGLGLLGLGSKDKWFKPNTSGPAIIILCILFLGCQTEKRLFKKGVKQGWIKPAKDSAAFAIPFDTTKNKKVSEDGADKIQNVLTELNNGYTPSEENKKAISKTIKDKIIPDAVNAAFKDTLIEKEDGTIIKITKSDKGFDAEVVYQKTYILDNTLPDWVKWFVIGSLLINGVLLYSILENARNKNRQ